MVRGWFTVKVTLVSGRGMQLNPPPGRIMLVGPDHTLKALAEAIDLAFGRWDLAHLHEFEFPDGVRYGFPDEVDDQPVIDYSQVVAGKVISRKVPFTYVFDLGDDWQHHCRLEHSQVKPLELAGIVPETPIPIWGWGWIPDQYGRRSEEDEGAEGDMCPLCGAENRPAR